MRQTILPISAIIPTRNRTAVLKRTLESLFAQSHLPTEVIVVDASDDPQTETMVQSIRTPLEGSKVLFQKADQQGAAVQRAQGLRKASAPCIFFMDDDIVFEKDCLLRIWGGFAVDERTGGVSAMIINQKYTAPGRITRALYRILSGERRTSYAGRLIGPAWNLLPDDSDDLPTYVECEWINTTCTMYKREALPQPLFPELFKGYSLLEDVALSAIVASGWKLFNARTARIFHDSQTGDHKKSLSVLAEMEFVNRFYIMREVLQRRGLIYLFKFLLFESFQVFASGASTRSVSIFFSVLRGKMQGLLKILG